MKIQLDTDNKTVKIEPNYDLKTVTVQQDSKFCNLGEFYDLLQKLLPNDLWREFKLEIGIINNFSSPIIIKEFYPINPFPLQPMYIPPYPTTPGPDYPQFPWITCDSGLNKGTFNIQT